MILRESGLILVMNLILQLVNWTTLRQGIKTIYNVQKSTTSIRITSWEHLTNALRKIGLTKVAVNIEYHFTVPQSLMELEGVYCSIYNDYAKKIVEMAIASSLHNNTGVTNNQGYSQTIMFKSNN